MTRRLRLPLAVAILAVLLDQATKALVRLYLPFGESWPEGWTLIRLARVENTGAAFGILQGAGGWLIVVTLVAIGAITFFLMTMPHRGRLFPLALSLILGGAVGNLIDRVRFGSVTDFIDPTHYPAFNLADSAIVVGVVTMFVVSWFEPDEDEEEHAAHPGQDEHAEHDTHGVDAEGRTSSTHARRPE
ncbi:MAG: signal peptidase II [Dehalococcoidia bacterium]